MNPDFFSLSSVISFVSDVVVAFFDSTFFAVVKFFLAIYVMVLLVNIVLLLIVRDPVKKLRQLKYGADFPAAHQGKLKKRWLEIEAHIKSGDSNRQKVAILSADDLVNEILQTAGHEGSNMRDRIESAPPGQIELGYLVLEAHKVRNAIVKDHSYTPDPELVETTINQYREFLESWEAL